jgi:hypothetical protein
VSKLNLLGVISNGQYDNFGELDLLEKTARLALADQGQGESPATAVFVSSVSRLTHSTIKAIGCETAWVCLRTFMPETEFTARWHRDGRFFIAEDDPVVQHKAVFALKGRLSLFTTIEEGIMAQFDEVERRLSAAYSAKDKSAIVAIQAELNAFVRPANIVRLQAPHQGALFNVGIPERAGVHSEPEFDSARWFMSVVPGSREQILALKQRWKSRRPGKTRDITN